MALPKKNYGIIGYPVKHSLSPLMHNAAFAALKIDAQYKLFEVQPQELDNFFHNLSRDNINGFNVTIPYKEKAIPFVADLSPEADLIGAVNTIKIENDKLCGFNTDGEGFLRHLCEELGFDPSGKSIALIGAGGAARAVSVYLSKTKPAKLSIYDIDRKKAEMLVAHLEKHFKDIEFHQAETIADLKINECQLLLNATAVGMKESDPLVVDESYLHKNMLVYDLIYSPAQTRLLKTAQIKGARVSNGLGMLLYQGAQAFKLWTGENAPIEVMRQALNEGVKNNA